MVLPKVAAADLLLPLPTYCCHSTAAAVAISMTMAKLVAATANYHGHWYLLIDNIDTDSGFGHTYCKTFIRPTCLFYCLVVRLSGPVLTRDRVLQNKKKIYSPN